VKLGNEEILNFNQEKMGKRRMEEDYVNFTEKFVGLSLLIVQIFINPVEECDDSTVGNTFFKWLGKMCLCFIVTSGNLGKWKGIQRSAGDKRDILL
jgi:hypothetical protein